MLDAIRYKSMFEDYKTKDSVVIVYTGEGKGKTSAALGLLGRALGTGWHCAFVQFIKYWNVGEDQFIKEIGTLYKNELSFYKGGKGFYKADDLSAKGVSEKEHKDAASNTYKQAMKFATSGIFKLVICDEINNAVHDGLLSKDQLEKLILTKHPRTSLCLTGRDFPLGLLQYVDVATETKKLKHHFDDKYLANKGIDY
jgi:cob(I)alamin adenosyltransferase